MIDIALKGIQGALLKIHPAEAQIGPFVPEEARALLDCVRIANTNAAGHVGNRESFYGEAPVHGLSTNEYPPIGTPPIYLGCPPATGIDFENAGVPECEAE